MTKLILALGIFGYSVTTFAEQPKCEKCTYTMSDKGPVATCIPCGQSSK